MSASKAPHNVSLLRLFKYFGVLVNTYKDTDINSIVYAARLYLNWPMFWSILNNNYQVPKKWSIKQYFVLATEYNTGLFENYRHGGVGTHSPYHFIWLKKGGKCNNIRFRIESKKNIWTILQLECQSPRNGYSTHSPSLRTVGDIPFIHSFYFDYILSVIWQILSKCLHTMSGSVIKYRLCDDG